MEAREIHFIATINPEAKPQYPDLKADGLNFTLEDLMRGKVVFLYPNHWTFEQY